MAVATTSYVFANGVTSDATQVDQNFTDLVNFLNSSVVHRDGSTSFTGVPSGPASDPVTDNQLPRKKYIDDRLPQGTSAWSTWTPTWATTGAAVVLGNGTIAGAYIKTGRGWWVSIDLVIGSTTNVGSGIYSFTLPTGFIAVAARKQVLQVQMAYNGQTALAMGHALVRPSATATDTTTPVLLTGTSASTPFQWSFGTPTLSAGDWVVVSGFLEGLT